MKLKLVCSVIALSFPAPALFGAESLFDYQAKTVTMDNLTPAQKQLAYEIEAERYSKIKDLADQIVLEQYIESEAKKAKKSADEVRKKLFAGAEPTDKEMKEFYEKNKERIPYPLEQVKDQLKQHLQQEKVVKAQRDVLEKVKKQGNFAFKLPEPIAPVLDIKTEGFATKGNPSSKLTIVEFADYQCPHCREAFEALEKVLPDFKDKVRFVFIDYPINASGISKVVAQGAYCAGKQNKYWEFHSQAFKGQKDLSKDSPKKVAEELKLDAKAFDACLSSPEAVTHVEKAKQEGDRVGIRGTPTIYLNGRRYVNQHTPEALKEAIQKNI